MGRSSRFICLACMLAATPAIGQARSVLVRVPTNAVHANAIRANAIRANAIRANAIRANTPRMMPRSTGVRAQATTSAIARRVPRGNGLGLFGAGLGISLAEDLAAPPITYGADRVAPSVFPDIVQAPCIYPRIIKIGHGLRHKVRTRVVYGTPNGCAR